jgi:hypothetical protein
VRGPAVLAADDAALVIDLVALGMTPLDRTPTRQAANLYQQHDPSTLPKAAGERALGPALAMSRTGAVATYGPDTPRETVSVLTPPSSSSASPSSTSSVDNRTWSRADGYELDGPLLSDDVPMWEVKDAEVLTPCLRRRNLGLLRNTDELRERGAPPYKREPFLWFLGAVRGCMSDASLLLSERCSAASS